MNCYYRVILSLGLLLSGVGYAQDLGKNQTLLKQQLSLCEARFSNNGFNSTLGFLVGCVNPAFESFFIASNAPPFMYESVKAQSLAIGAKVDSEEMDLKSGLESIFAVVNQSVTILLESNNVAQTTNGDNSIVQPAPPSIDVDAIKRLCTSRGVASRDALAIQFDNQWLSYQQNNPAPIRTGSPEKMALIRQGATSLQLAEMDLRESNALRVWQNSTAENKKAMDSQKYAATTRTYTNTYELCLRENGL